MSDDPSGFVPLRALKGTERASSDVLREIRDLYFKTTKRTIQHDLAHAVSLLRTLPLEEDREKARVYMDGLAQMRTEWAKRK